jgi:hypothetical protein
MEKILKRGIVNGLTIAIFLESEIVICNRFTVHSICHVKWRLTFSERRI